MTIEGFKRKLTAILSADVIGYSRLMRDDEEATVRDLAAHRVLITEIIQQHHGRVVDSPGDNILAEFASVVDAVNGAIKIQDEIKENNAGVPEDRRMEFRIGINLGDVIEEEERIYGDGVNIAARVEGLAAGGGIAISGTVYEHIKDKLSLGYHYLGEQDVKNIPEPVRVYRILTEPEDAGKMIVEEKPKSKKFRWAASGAIALFVLMVGTVAIWNFYSRPSFEPASIEKMAHPLPDKPSIAVLPFKNISGDSEQEFLADGITESIIGAISRVSGLFVIASNSVFTYKGKAVKIQTVSEDLGVQYVLEGTVQRVGNRLRVNAQLIDAITGRHLWSEKYDQDLKDIFSVQDNISKEVLTALRVKLVEGEQARIWAKGTNNLDAYIKFLKAYDQFRSFTKNNIILTRKFCQEAINLDRNYEHPYSIIGVSHVVDLWFGWGESPRASMEKAEVALKKALAINPLSDVALANLNQLLLMQKRFDEAVAAGEKSIALNPNGDLNMVLLGITFNYVRRYEEAITLFKEANRRNPFGPAWYIHNMGISYRGLGRWDEAIAECQRALDRNPNHFPALVVMASVYGMAGRMDEGRAVAAKILKINPRYSIENTARLAFKCKSDLEAIRDGLRKAGIPEHPPLKLPDKPSVALLPFKNLSGDPEQEYLSDGFTEDIITTLAKIPRMFVIARESSFSYKGKSVKIQEVGRDLGVRYVLEGSIQKSGERLRITAQLIDAAKGHHLWAEKYDRDLKDIFALKDEITKEIAIALQVKLTEGEWARTWGAKTNNFEAYIKVKQSLEHFRRFTPDDNILSRQKAKEALDLDPNYSTAMEMLAWTLLMDGVYGTSKTPEKSIEQAFELAKTVLDRGDNDGPAHYLLGYAYRMNGQFEKAIAELEIAHRFEPNSAEINAGLGMILKATGKPQEAINAFKNAVRLNPIPPSWYLTLLGECYRMTGQYEKALHEFKKAIQLQPDNMFTHMNLAVIYVYLGQEENAQTEAAEVLRIDSKFSLERYAKQNPWKDEAAKQKFIDALRKAGLPE